MLSRFIFALLIVAASGLKLSGSVTGMPASVNVVYVGKFAFSSGEGLFNANFIGLEGTQLAIYDDQPESWPFVINSQGCGLQLAAAKTAWFPVNSPQSTPVQVFVEESYNRWWYVAFVNCNSTVSVSDYSLEFLNGDTNQLGENQIGLPVVYTLFFVILCLFLISLAVVPSLRAFFKHPMSRWLVLAISIESFSRMILMAYYQTLAETGNQLLGLFGFGVWLDQMSQIVILWLVLLVAFGWNFNAFSGTNKVVVVSSLAMYAIFGIFLVVWGVGVNDAYWFVDTLLATPWGVLLTFVRMVVLAVVCIGAFFTIRRERRMERRTWMIKFLVVETIWQTLYILTSFISNGLPSWQQARFVWSVLSIINTANLGALIFLLQPRVVGDLFGSAFGPATLTGISEEFLETPGGNPQNKI